MRDMPSSLNSSPAKAVGRRRIWFYQQLSISRFGLIIPLLIVLLGAEVYRATRPKAFVQIELEQAWALEPGDRLGRYSISSGLGDVVIELNGAPLYMPMAGEIQPLTPTCSLFASPELPAYRLRLCGLYRPQTGPLAEGAVIGRGDRVALALLRRQPQGRWTMVEPATSMLEQFLVPVQP